MSTTFPCPKPGCTYLFDTRQLPPAAMVTCPLCKTRFPYRAGQVLAQNTAPPAGQVLAQNTAPPEPVTSEPIATINYRPHQASNNVPKMILIFVGIFAALLVTLLTIYKMVNRNPLDATTQVTGLRKDDTYNFSFNNPGKDWQTDSDVRAQMDINIFSLKHSGPDGWVTLAAKDFKDHNPRPAEEEYEMTYRLKKFFKNVEFEQKTDSKKTLGGRTARYYVYTGDVGGVQMTGDCYLMSYKGITYAMFAWAASDTVKELLEPFADIRERFGLLDRRESWSEKKSSTKTFALKEGAYSITDFDGVWIGRTTDQSDFTGNTRDTFIDPPKDIDPRATIALRGKFPIKNPKSQGIDFVPVADALVLELDKAGDPQQMAKKYLEERLAKEDAAAESKTTLEEAKDAPAEGQTAAGDTKVTRYYSKDSQAASSNKLFVVSALSIPGKVVVVVAECNPRDAKYMEPYMLKLAGSLTAK